MARRISKLPSGNYPAVDYARAVTARDLIRSRRRLGMSQSELARRAKVRVEILNRIERAKATGGPKVMERLDAVLNQLEAQAASAGKSGHKPG